MAVSLHDVSTLSLIAELRRRGYQVIPPPRASRNTPEALRARILDAIEEIDRRARQFGLVRIPELRRALPDVERQALDTVLLELGAERRLQLIYHDHPASLSAEERAACLPDPKLAGVLYYWVRLS